MSFPSLNELIEEYRTRKWDPYRCWHDIEVGGYERPKPQIDQKRLLVVAQRYLERFANCLQHLSMPEDDCLNFSVSSDYGLFHRVKVEGKGYIRGDIHGDLATTLALFEHLKNIGLIDENCICACGVKLFFLGDFKGLGTNDIEVLTLFLLLKIENPDSVFLFKGDHEDTKNELPLEESYDWRFFLDCRNVFSPIFATFPVCMSSEGGKGRIYLGHANFAPFVDLNGSSEWMGIPTSVVKEFKSRKEKTTKQQNAIEKLHELLNRQIIPKTLGGKMTTCGEVGQIVGFDPERSRFEFDAEIIQSFLRANGFGAMVRAHQHKYREVKVQGKRKEKVICTTLPVATAATSYGKTIGEQESQGILFEPRGRVRHWRKWIDKAFGTGPDIWYAELGEYIHMYDSADEVML
jgi:hypothetical protein